MMPKWIGSTPSSIAIGSRIGARMRIADEVSITQPTNSSRMLTRTRNCHGCRSHAAIVDEICPGIRSEASTTVKRMPLAMMNITMAEVRAEAIVTSHSSENLISR